MISVAAHPGSSGYPSRSADETASLPVGCREAALPSYFLFFMPRTTVGWLDCRLFLRGIVADASTRDETATIAYAMRNALLRMPLRN